MLSENDMELDERIGIEGDEETLHGETNGVDEKMVRTPHPYSLWFPYMLLLVDLCVFVVFVVVHVAKVWVFFHPGPLGMI